MIQTGTRIALDSISEVSPEKIFQWRNSPQVFRYCRQWDLLDWGQHVDWYERQLSGDSDSKMYAMRAEDVGGEVVGICGLTGIDLINRRAEFSLYVAPEFQRKGYARAGLISLVTHGFMAYGLESIWGETFEFNLAKTLFETLGFKRDGVRRNFYFREGRFIDAILYSVLRTEWRFPEGEKT